MVRHSKPGEVTILLSLGLLLAGCSNNSDGSGTPPDPGSSASTSHPSDSSSPAPHLPAAATSLAAGRYTLSFLANPGVETPDALIEIPSGFDDDGVGWYVVSHDNDAFFGLWTVGQVQRDACLEPLNDDVTPGPSAEDLAEALVAQTSTSAAAPKPVTLAGYGGLYVELASPNDLSTCDPEPGLWGDPGARGIYSAGQVDRVWILDVAGQRLVIDAAHGPTASRSEIDNLTSMVESLEFVAALP
jgi:hypothetical protein